MDYRKIKNEILENIGGESNVENLTHCATRLRFVVKDESKVNLDSLENIDGVLKAQNKAGQTQVVVGSIVERVYKEITDTTSIAVSGEQATEKKAKFSFNAILETISGVFTPILPALIGCGMMKSVTALLLAFKLVDPSSGFVQILNMIGDSVFYFMPFFLAVSAAQKFKTNTFLAVALAATYMHPTIWNAANSIADTGVNTINFLGLPILLVKYNSTIIPIIISVWALRYVYKFVDKLITPTLKVILVPLLTLLIMVPFQLIVIGPFGSYVGTWLAQGISFLFNANGIIAGAMLGFFRPILVMFGMHYSIMPMQVQQIADFGYSVMLPSAIAANLAQAGAVTGVFLLSKKNKTMKAAAASAAITASLGVTEPAIYGVNLKYKKPFYAGCISAGIVAGFFGFVNASAVSISIPGILALPTYQADSYIYIILGTIAAFALGLILTLVFGIDEMEDTTTNTPSPVGGIKSPLQGEVVALSDVNDQVFSQGLVGQGVAVKPTEGKVFAPFDGVVEVAFASKHALGLKSTDGVEVLIHVGIDTVNLEGKFFTSYVTQGETVKQGQLLLEFDLEGIKEAGYDTVTPVIITNSDSLDSITVQPLRDVTTNEMLFAYKNK